MPQKNPAKRQTPNAGAETLKAQRAARKAARLAAKQKEARDLADFRERARVLCSRMPAQFQDWGVTRTRAHLKLMAILKHKAELKTIKADRLGDLVQRLETSDQWSLPYCQALSQLSDTAVDVSCTE